MKANPTILSIANQVAARMPRTPGMQDEYSLCPLCGGLIWSMGRPRYMDEPVVIDEINTSKICHLCERIQHSYPEVFAWVNRVAAFTRALAAE